MWTPRKTTYKTNIQAAETWEKKPTNQRIVAVKLAIRLFPRHSLQPNIKILYYYCILGIWALELTLKDEIWLPRPRWGGNALLESEEERAGPDDEEQGQVEDSLLAGHHHPSVAAERVFTRELLPFSHLSCDHYRRHVVLCSDQFPSLD